MSALLPYNLSCALAAAGAAPWVAHYGLKVAWATDTALHETRPVCSPLSIGLGATIAAIAVFVAPTLSLTTVAIAAVLGAIATADSANRIIPDLLVLSLAMIGLFSRPFAPFVPWQTLVWAGVSVYLIGKLFSAVMRWRHKQVAFGAGDVKMMAALAANIPSTHLAFVFLTSGILALCGHCIRPVRHLPFGPYLALGALVACKLTHCFFSPIIL